MTTGGKERLQMNAITVYVGAAEARLPLQVSTGYLFRTPRLDPVTGCGQLLRALLTRSLAVGQSHRPAYSFDFIPPVSRLIGGHFGTHGEIRRQLKTHRRTTSTATLNRLVKEQQWDYRSSTDRQATWFTQCGSPFPAKYPGLYHTPRDRSSRGGPFL